MNITIFDGRRVWLEPVFQEISCSASSDDGSVPTKSNHTEYELNSYTISTKHNLLSIKNMQKLVSLSVDCYKDQVLVKDIRGDYARVDIYVKRWGIALIQNTLNHVFSEVQHMMIEDIMRNQVNLEHYNKIDEIFEKAVKVWRA